MLTSLERNVLIAPERLDIGTYRAWGPARRDCVFVVEVDARPLAILAEAAALGSRVYELMSISRPGDMLHYLWIRLVTVGDEVVNHIKARKRDRDEYYWHFADKLSPVNEMALVEFDSYFSWAGDDTEPFAEKWLEHRDGDYWKAKMRALLAITEQVQARLRAKDDFLLCHEIALIDRQQHMRDALSTVERRCEVESKLSVESALPPRLFQAIPELIALETVQSVSCPFNDHSLWRLLVAEQTRRALRLGVSPQTAFGLNGPEGDLSLSEIVNDWGGRVHIPYEGACDADLFIKPHWYRFDPEVANASGCLELGFGKRCNYLLTEEDCGELTCARRRVLGDGWILYESNAKYRPNNRFAKSHPSGSAETNGSPFL
jgi:hypothetical protein